VKLFLSPHNDDEALFGAFTILREQPLVIVVFDSFVQVAAGNPECNWKARRNETASALAILNPHGEVRFLGIPDDRSVISWTDFENAMEPFRHDVEHVYAPAIEDGGHQQHNLVGKFADHFFHDRVTHYMTYTNRGKSTSNKVVPFSPRWLSLKLNALSCYETQTNLPSTRDHFLRDQHEYYE
jgi:LmbE family N-acetylglucosaminyl deacetylase